MSSKVLVLPDRERVRGADSFDGATWRGGDGSRVRVGVPVPGTEALDRRWPTDAHALPVVFFRGAEPIASPRPRKALLKAGVWPSGVMPRLTWAFVDVDGAGHTRDSANVVRQLDTLRRVCRRLPRPIIYSTRNGWRLAWSLDPSPEVSGADAVELAEGRLRHLRRRIGAALAWGDESDAGAAAAVSAWAHVGLRPPDGAWTGATAAVTTCYRLPRVRRDGVDVEPEVSCVDGETLDLTGFGSVGARAILPRARPSIPALGWGRRQRRIGGEEAWAEAALRGECARVTSAPEGTRHDQLFRAAASLGGIVGGGLLCDETVTGRLMEAVASGPYRDARAAEKTIRDGLTRGRSKPRGPKER